MTDSRQVTLLCVGDIHAGEVTTRLCPAIQDLAARADVVIVNLESPLTEGGAALGVKSLHLRSAPANVQVLRALSTDVACLANNHICDWGGAGLADTRRILGENGIAAVGAGMNLSEAEAPVILERGGLRIGILAFGSQEIETVPAGADRPGCAVLDEPHMRTAIAELRARAEVVVVAVHWGYTNYHYPLPEDVALGRSLIDAGATLVVGHHPHVIQGYERRAQGAILYSLGNFIFAPYRRRGRPVPLSRENHTAAVCLVKAGSRGVQSLDFIHTRQTGECGTIELVPLNRLAGRRRLLCRLSRPLARQRYAAFFRRYVLRRMIGRTVRRFQPGQWHGINRELLTGIRTALRRVVRG